MKTKKEIEKVEKLIEAGEYGEIDYQWNGKKILKDNIKFKRNEFFELLGIVIQSEEKEMLDEFEKIIEEEIKCPTYDGSGKELELIKEKLKKVK